MRSLLVIMLCCVVAALQAADADPLLEPVPLRPAVDVPRRRPQPETPRRDPQAPSDLARLLGGEQPALAPGAWWIRWDEYRTLVVVDKGGGQVRPAWVATYDAVNGVLVVAYRAQARLDAEGSLRIEGRSAVVNGPQAWQWSPDSFLIGNDRQVTTFDENVGHPGNHGEVERMIDGRKDAEAYRLLLRTVIILVGGTA